MGTEFKAASGRTVRVGGDGSVMFGRVNGFLSREATYDAEEYFQAKHDEELGRWRWPLDPDYVAYLRDDEPRRVRVIRESTGDFTDTVEGSTLDGPFKDAARAYFEAHPAPKPWHDAKAGEFWSVEHLGIEVCRVDDVNGTLRFVGVDGRGLSVSMPITYHSITNAVQLVAEVAA